MSIILEKFPDAQEFYKTYWGKKPFIVRGYIPEDVIESLIDGDTLAGLALEEEIKSRLVTNTKNGEWACEHGPLNEDRFDDIGDKNWSLLVQNVEQYHTDTAKLLLYFQSSPRWLLDDIMVSFSATGGSVGPHTDSYHTFLVQGMGKRAWKISDHKIDDDHYVDNPDMKILQNGFDGETYEVTAGDVIYMPPFFGHEGKTLEAAMTFSVGFLGPKLSEMLGEYALYLEENESLNKRFLGENFTTKSSAFIIGDETKQAIQSDVISSIQSDDFTTWMAAYFSTPTDGEVEDFVPQDDRDLLSVLKDGATLIRAEHVKLTITKRSNGDYNLAILGEVIIVNKTLGHIIEKLNFNLPINFDDVNDNAETIQLIKTLYQQNILCI